MATTLASFTTPVTTGLSMAENWNPHVVDCLYGLASVWQGKESLKTGEAGAEPLDRLRGWNFGDERAGDPGNIIWGLYADDEANSQFLLRVNTNTDASPTWSDRVRFVEHSASELAEIQSDLRIVRVSRSSDLAVTAGSYQNLALNSEDEIDSDAYSNTSGQITITNTGWYAIEAQIKWENETDGYRGIKIAVTGTASSFGDIRNTAISPDSSRIGLSRVRMLTAGDVLTLQGLHNSATDPINAESGAENTYMQIVRLA